MIKSAQNYPVSQLFDIESSVVYHVPRYQREYAWTKPQWESFFDDTLEHGFGYFLGSILCINTTVDTFDQTLEVIDGQQRLLTLSLLFAAVYATLKQREVELDTEQLSSLTNLKRRLTRKRDGQLRVVPQIQNNNERDYRGVLSEIGLIPPCEVPRYAGNRKIFRAFRYLQDRVEKLPREEHGGIEQILDFLGKVNQASLVKIEVGSHADAYTLFESLNNRGVPLTAIDLIKTKLLGRLEILEPGKIDHYFSRWNSLLSCLSDDYSVQERFFRQYYNAFRERLKEVYAVPIATRSNLIRVHEELIDKDPKEFIEEVTKAGKQYATLLLRDGDEIPNQLRRRLTNLHHIEGAPSYVLLLNLLMRRTSLCLEEKHLADIIDALVCFFVRRNLTDVPPTRDLPRRFMYIIGELNGSTSDEVVRVVKTYLQSISASDDYFRQKLSGKLYEENEWVTRFILCSLEEASRTKESWVDLWKRDRSARSRFVFTVEHVLPQGENLPQCWIDMIAGGDKDRARAIQNSHSHMLGNLTLSGFNSALGNKCLAEKRDRTDREGRYVGYKNSFKLNAELANATEWTARHIEERTHRLVEETMGLFSFT